MSAVQLHQLNPTEAVIKLKGKEYTLRKFDLLAQTWAHSEFATEDQPDGLLNLRDRVINFEKDFAPIFKCCWHLLKRKRDFNSYENFVKAIGEGDDDADQNKKIGELLMAFQETLGASQLTEDDVKDDLELKKL